MYSVELYRRLQETEHAAGLGRVRRHPARVLAGADGGDPPADQLGHGVRAAVAGDLGGRGAGAVPADGHRRVSSARAYLRVGRLRRPVAALLRAGRPGRGRRVCRCTRTPGSPASTPSTGGSTRVHTDRGTIACEIVVNCGGMFAAEIGRMLDVRIPLVPMSHQYVVTEAFLDAAGRPSGRCRRCATPTCSSTTGRRSTGWSWAATSGTPSRGPPTRRSLRRDPGRLQRPAAARELGPVRGDHRQLPGAGAGDGRRRPAQDHQRPGGVHAGQRVHPRRDRRRRVLRRGRLLRARHRRRRRHRQGDGRVDRLRRPWHGPVAHGRHAGSGAQYRSPSYTLDADAVENYETYYDIVYPGQEREAGRPLRTSPAYAWHVAHGASFGEKSGWERVNWYERNAPARRRVVASPGVGRAGTGRPRSASSTRRPARRRRCSTSRRSRS